MRKILYCVNAASILLILLSIAVFIPAYSSAFYSKEYDKHSIPQSISVPKEDLMIVTDNLINYMKGKDAELDSYAHVAGEYRPFFSQREKDHMVDVRGLLLGGMTLRNFCFFFTLAVALMAFYTKDSKTAVKYTLFTIIIIMLAILILFIIISMNFEYAFVLFHEIFFNNDLWILDPNVDLLVNIVPLPFFIDIAARVGGLFVLMVAITVLILWILLRRGQPRQNKGTRDEPVE